MCRTEDNSVKPLHSYCDTGSGSQSQLIRLAWCAASSDRLLNTQEPLNSLLIVDPFSQKIIIKNLLRTVCIRQGFPSYLSIMYVIPVIIKVPMFYMFIS